MNMAAAIDKLAQSPVAEFKEFQRHACSTGLSNSPHHPDYQKDMSWVQFNKTFTSVAFVLGP